MIFLSYRDRGFIKHVHLSCIQIHLVITHRSLLLHPSFMSPCLPIMAFPFCLIICFASLSRCSPFCLHLVSLRNLDAFFSLEPALGSPECVFFFIHLTYAAFCLLSSFFPPYTFCLFCSYSYFLEPITISNSYIYISHWVGFLGFKVDLSTSLWPLTLLL